MGEAFIVFIIICILAWKILNFALAGAIYFIRRCRVPMVWCEDTARGILGGIVAFFVLIAILC